MSSLERLRTTQDEPRIIIPFRDREGNVFGYRGVPFLILVFDITILLEEGRPKIFGLNTLDYDQTIYVTEGPFDSLFSRTVLLWQVLTYLDADPSNNVVFIYDNEPRNKQITDRIAKHIDSEHSVVIWPSHIKQKDINDMFLAGIPVQNIVESNTYLLTDNSTQLMKMIKEEIGAKKRNGRGTESLDLNKIHVMVEEACKGLAGVCFPGGDLV